MKVQVIDMCYFIYFSYRKDSHLTDLDKESKKREVKPLPITDTFPLLRFNFKWKHCRVRVLKDYAGCMNEVCILLSVSAYVCVHAKECVTTCIWMHEC